MQSSSQSSPQNKQAQTQTLKDARHSNTIRLGGRGASKGRRCGGKVRENGGEVEATLS
jgi:hypothetical protein